jgi:hypothetical protein
MKLQSSLALLLLNGVLNNSDVNQVNAVPMRHSIAKASKECLYTIASAGEHITNSVFILDGAELKARMIVQGPIATNKVNSAAEVLAAALRFDKTAKGLSTNVDLSVDFENLYDDLDSAVDDDDFMGDSYYDDDNLMNDIDDAMFEEYYYLDDDDEYAFMIDDNMDDMEIKEAQKKREEKDGMSDEDRNKAKEERKAEKIKRFEMMKKQRADMKERRAEKLSRREQKKKNQKDAQKENQKGLNQLRSGEAYQKTYQVEEDGWYRYCVLASNSVIEVEMELRKSSELGKPNSKTGHIQTQEHYDMVQREKKLLKRMEAMPEEGVKEEDLQYTKHQISTLNRLLYDIKEKQTNERHRLAVHRAVNEHSHSRMVLSSLFETIFYIVVSGFQVYTIRKWFSGSPILGY